MSHSFHVTTAKVTSQPFAYTPSAQDIRACPDHLAIARVVTHLGHNIEAQLIESQVTLQCKTRTRSLDIVVGDWVTLDPKRCLIIERLTRQSVFIRPTSRGQQKPIAANISLVVLVVAIQPIARSAMIDRYLAHCAHLSLNCMICFNKLDCCTTVELAAMHQQLDEFRLIGYPTLWLSCKTGEGIATLQQTLARHCSVLLGQSGVGKSSIINALLPHIQAQPTGSLSARTGLGKHTTTTARYFPLTAEGGLIDAPGLQDLPVDCLSAQQLKSGFREIHALADQCRFNDCAHIFEPHCAVKQAVDARKISARRWHSYCALMMQARS